MLFIKLFYFVNYYKYKNSSYIVLLNKLLNINIILIFLILIFDLYSVVIFFILKITLKRNLYFFIR